MRDVVFDSGGGHDDFVRKVATDVQLYGDHRINAPNGTLIHNARKMYAYLSKFVRRASTRS